MRLTSKTQKLLELREKHPNWSYKQYAEYLGQSHETIRSVLSRLGLSRKKRGRPRNDERDQSTVKKRKKIVVDRPKATVFSKSGPRSSGYTKLM